MDLGRFSLSLAVADLDASVTFYESLDFEVVDGGHASEHFPDTEDCRWRVLRHGDTLLGLYEGMFDRNLLAFHPTDVRSIQERLRERGVEIVREIGDDESGPVSIMLRDPDGNPIMLDQP